VRVRAATYNVRGFRDGLDRVAGVIGELAPDLLLLQESGSRRRLRRLARTTGLQVAGDPWSPLRRRVKNAVLVAPPWRIEHARLERLEPHRPWHPRGALVARVTRGPGTGLWALSLHLGLDGPERGHHARAVVELCDRLVTELDDPIVLGGDLNATPDMAAVHRLTGRLLDCWTEEQTGATFPATTPVARIDYVLASDGLRPGAARVGAPGADGASDHLPVVVDMEA
jgi:endonuclease/exonuclease/phosphatase family metal-dependent hydrolase